MRETIEPTIDHPQYKQIQLATAATTPTQPDIAPASKIVNSVISMQAMHKSYVECINL